MFEEKKNNKSNAPEWVLVLGGALISTLSIRLCCKLKQVFEVQQPLKKYVVSKENLNPMTNRRYNSCKLHSHLYCFAQDENGCYQCLSAATTHTVVSSQRSKDGENSLPLVKIPSTHSSIDDGGMWASVPDLLELPPKPFNHPNSLDSPCISESGSDIYSKREVVQKLRQQLKRRDEMIIEMQAQITDLQSSLSVQLTYTTHLQAQLDSSNQELLDLEREIQRLQKAIADRCVEEIASPEEPMATDRWLPEAANGYGNGFINGLAEGEKIKMLMSEVEKLKEVIEGKEFMIQSYKEQKMELGSKIKELQLRLVSEASVPNIL
ncbi:hypothetical protein AXF42_Ash005143 [Apostasia shenzhenica]|uniref:Uncharacterized protein n=1 Tax=Apostasia shenzhenica TaxID=1088818 RepID=A0A2I0B8Q9_9ASPA|nr:hypothetical protein AXF42_Ash005143 [Apostasia shenzhenica]